VIARFRQKMLDSSKLRLRPWAGLPRYPACFFHSTNSQGRPRLVAAAISVRDLTSANSALNAGPAGMGNFSSLNGPQCRLQAGPDEKA
jgi:hypothetical protein